MLEVECELLRKKDQTVKNVEQFSVFRPRAKVSGPFFYETIIKRFLNVTFFLLQR